LGERYNKKDKYGKCAIDIAREKDNENMIQLLESFQENPFETRFRLRKQFGLAGIF